MGYTLHTSTVHDFARRYTGPRFHALLCDPPYHLTNRTIDNPYCPECCVSRSMSTRECSVCGTALVFTKTRNEREGFMGKTWDGGDIAYRPETWRLFWDMLHPGAFGFAFASTRGQHRMICAIEDAGYIIHSVMGWLFGSGFPKATRIDTQLDKAAGVEREVVGHNPNHRPISGVNYEGIYSGGNTGSDTITAPATDEAQRWEGHRYGRQALKPALEIICVFQKPYEGRPVDCIVATGAGSLNIEAGRVGTAVETWPKHRSYAPGQKQPGGKGKTERTGESPPGRWPSNFALMHSPDCVQVGTRRVKGTKDVSQYTSPSTDNVYGAYHKRSSAHHADPDGKETIAEWQCAEGCPVAELDAQSGDSVSSDQPRHNGEFKSVAKGCELPHTTHGHNDTGGASRFFYTGKSSSFERTAGLDARSTHPTMKPLKLISWLANLLLPPPLDGQARRLLIPFAGVASEMIGARLAGWDHVEGIEAEAEYTAQAIKRLEWWAQYDSYEAAKGEHDEIHTKARRIEKAHEAAQASGQLRLFDMNGAS